MSVRTPGWTDPHGRDPGITLVQLLPWLAVALLFVVAVRASRRRRAPQDG